MKILRTTIKRVWRLLSGMRLPDPDMPPETMAGVREPRRRGPGGRSSAVALSEPDDDPAVDAVAGTEAARRRYAE